MSSRDKSDFFFSKIVLGTGAFSRVFLAFAKDSNELVAMKIMEKSFIRNKLEYVNVKNELGALIALQDDAISNCIINLLFAFQDSKYLYIGMEIASGTLRDYIDNMQAINELTGKFNIACDLKTARFLIAELVIAVQYIHQKGIIHRDLNPNNILLSSDGHVRLADFGTAILLVNEDPAKPPLATFVGLADYIPPEVSDSAWGTSLCTSTGSRLGIGLYFE